MQPALKCLDDLTTTAGSPLAGAGWAEGPLAVRHAVADAVAAVPSGHPSVVLVFPDAALPPGEVMAQAALAARGCRVAGMTSDGLVTAVGVGRRGCSALAFGPHVAVGIGVADEASSDMRAAGRAAAERALAGLAPRPGHAVLLLLLDPTSGDEMAAIDGAYSVAGPALPLAGGGANGAAPGLLADGSMRADRVVAVALVSPGPVTVGDADGCTPLGGPAIATRTAGRVVLDLNGLPAEQVYLEALGHSGAVLDDRAFEALAILHPLAQPELGGRLRLRHVSGRAPRGGLACATAIPANSAVWFTRQTVGTIVESAGRAAEEALAAVPAMPEAALVFDCAARKRALGSELAAEGVALRSALRGAGAVAGLYTRGEVARRRGAKGDRNHAVVVVGFG